MKTCTPEKFDVIRLSHPNARIEKGSDGQEYVIVPTYDFDTDESGEIRMLLVRSERQGDGASFQPGDVVHNQKTGAIFNIVDPLARLLKLRKGPNADG